MSFIDKLKGMSKESRRIAVSGILIGMMTITACLSLVAAAVHEVVITDGETVITAKTNKKTVGELFAEQQITVGQDDYVSAGMDARVAANRSILIRRAVDVSVCDAGKTMQMRTAKTTVGGLLEEKGIAFDENDEITPGVNEQVAAGMQIEVVRVDYATVSREEVLGYSVEETESADIEKGKSAIVTEGKNGFANVTYQVTLRNGQEAEANEVAKEIVQQPVNKVVANGTKIVAQPVVTLASRGGSASSGASAKASGGSVDGSRMLVCRATAYDGSYATLGKTNARTATGEVPQVGVVAVDPKVIPLGSKLYIEAADGSYVYGYCRAADTGVSGYHVDLFMGSRSQALSFGSRTVNVYILN